MIRRRVKVGHDRHGQYIRYRGQKIYLSQAIIKKGTKSGMDNLDLIKWILKQLALRRRRRRRRARERRRSDRRSQKDYQNYAEGKVSAGPTGPKLPLSMTHLPTMIYENQRLLDKAKQLERFGEAKKLTTNEVKRLTADGDLKLLETDFDPQREKVQEEVLTDIYGPPDVRMKNAIHLDDGSVILVPLLVVPYRDQLEQNLNRERKERLQNEIKDLETKLETKESEISKIIDRGDDKGEKIGDIDSLIAQLKDLGVTLKGPGTGRGKPSKASLIAALKHRIAEIDKDPDLMKKYWPEMKGKKFFTAWRKLLSEKAKIEKDLADKNMELNKLEKPKPEQQPEPEPKPKSEPKPKAEPKPKSEQLPPRDLRSQSRGINLGGEPLPSTTIEEVDDDDTQPDQYGPERKRPNPEDEVVDSDLDDSDDTPAVKVPPPGVSAQGDGSRNSKKVMKSSPPLDEHKINELMADIPGYLGTITKDEIPKLTKAAKKTWLAGMPFGWIHLTISRAQAVGNNERPGEVGHWVAVAVVPGRGAVMYYDSFGRPAPADVKTALKAMFDKVAPREFLKFKENLIQEQSVNTNNCGWFSIKFLLDIFGGMEFTDTTPWNRSVQAERDIEKFKKKFKPFSWL